MSNEQIEIIENFKAGDLEFELGKGYVVVAKRKGKIVAIRAVTHWFHAGNIAEKLQKDINYRKDFIEKYGVRKGK